MKKGIASVQVSKVKHWLSSSTSSHLYSSATGTSTHGDSNLISDYEKALPFDNIPGPGGFKYIGTAHQFILGRISKYKYQDLLCIYFDYYGPIFKEPLFKKTIVHVSDPEMIKVIYKDEGKLPVIEPLVEPTQRFRGEENMSLGLGNTNGEEWYKLRSAVQKHMMKPTEVSQYLPQVNQVANEFVDKILKKGFIDDFLLEVSKWSLESSGYISFGKRLGYLEEGSEKEDEAVKLIKMNDRTFTLATKLKFTLPLYKYMKTPTYISLLKSEQYFHNVTRAYLDETLEKLENGTAAESKSDDYRFVHALVSQGNLSKNDVEVIVLSMFSDGLRTLVPVFISVMYFLAQSPRVQEKLYNEIKTVVGDKDDIDVSDISKMPYLKACVKETFRLHPNNLDISRINHNNIVLGGYQIPSGTKLSLNNFYMNRNPDIFEQPDSFIPERWIRGASENDNIHPYLFIPFGRGTRMCAGRRFAEQDLYVLTSKFIQKSRPHWRGGTFRHQYKVLIYPDCSVQFEFQPRH